MPLTQNSPTISGNLVIDGTLEAKHIKANTITANKFSGAVQEQYWSYTDDVDLAFSYSTYATVHEWTFPKCELDIFKGRHVSYNTEGYMNTGTSSQYTGKVYFKLEAEVPAVQSSTIIGQATHVSAITGWQTVSLDGFIPLNRIGSGGSVGLIGGSYRTYKNLKYDPKALQGADLVTNGNFNSGTADWTLGEGTHSSGYGAYSLATAASTTGFSYQAITTEVGKLYQITGNIVDGVASGEIRVASAANLDNNNTIATSTVQSGSASVDFEFVATGTTTYVVLIASGSAASQTVGFDNLVVKQYIDKTFLEISTTGGQIVPTGTPTNIYYHPYSGASSGSWQVVDTHIRSDRTVPYTNYFRYNADVYVGWFNDAIKLRLRCLNNAAFGKTLTLNNLKIFMDSRIVE